MMDKPLITGQQIHHRAAVLTCGALQVSIGAILVVLNIADFAFGSDQFIEWNTVFGSGIWAGGFFITGGAFGIVSGYRLPLKTQPASRIPFLVTGLVFGALSLVLTLLLAPASFALTVIFPYNYYSYENSFLWLVFVHFAFYLVMFIVSLVQVIVTSISIHKMPAGENDGNNAVKY